MKKTLSEILDSVDTVAKSVIPSDVKYLPNEPFYVLARITGFTQKVIDVHIEQTVKSLFIHTAETIEDILSAGKNIPLTQNKATIAKGNAIIQGNVGYKIPINQEFSFNGNIYYTTSYTEVFNSVDNPIQTTSHDNGLVTITTPLPHNLASNIKINVTGFLDNAYNGNDLVITVIDEYSFVYSKSGIVNNPTQVGKYSLQYAVLELSSSETGFDKNIRSGEELTIESQITDLESKAYVTYNGIDGGSDDEDIESLRTRGLELIRSLNAPYGIDYFKNEIKKINNVNNIKILPATPSLGFATILFTVKNYSSPIPSGTLINLVKEKINSIKSPVMNLENYIVEAPLQVVYDIAVSSFNQITSYQKEMIIGVVQGYFGRLEIGLEPSIGSLESLISTTPDINGNYLETFSLTFNPSEPFTNKSIAIIGNITF